MLIFSRVPLFLWAEAIATACYTQNRSIIHRRLDKKPYELINGRKPNMSFLYVFRALCYPKNDCEDIGNLGAKGDTVFFIGYSANSYAYRVYNRRIKKIMKTMHVTFDELSAMAFEQSSLKPGLQSMTSRQITAPRTTLAAQAPQVLQTLTASTTIANTNNQASLQPETVVDNVLNDMFDGNTYVNPFATSSTSAAESSSSQYVDPSNMHMFYQPYPNEYQWTKDHPLEQVIGEPSRPVLIRNQLRSDGDMCMYALTVSTMKPKNVKEAMIELAWIESMQEELLQFKRLDNHFFKGTIDPTLFIKRFDNDILVAKPTEKHLKEVKRIFRYLWGTINMGLWYKKDFGFKLTEFSDADYVGCKDTFKSTSGGAQFLGEKL
nr:retrovirus-related Pol polyprotein from transposon TNT 1-94 [Tanacetum cinerariifolium]